MGKYQAIAATSNAFRLMLERAAIDSESSDATAELIPADKLQNPSSATKQLVFRSRIRAEKRAHQPSLPIDFHYLITAWPQNAATAQVNTYSASTIAPR
jgi:hypothetical protein